LRDTSVDVSGILDNESNKPLEIYDVYLDSATLHFVANTQNVNFYDPDGEAQEYIALGISRGNIETSVDTKVDSVAIRLDNVNLAMSSYVSANELRGRKVIIRKVFADISGTWDSDDDLYLFNGMIDQQSIGESVMEIQCVSRAGTFEIETPRRMYGLLCPWKFASTGCTDGLSANTLYAAITGTVEANSTISEIKDSARTEAENYWNYGQVEFKTGDNTGASRVVTDSENGAFTLNYALSNTPGVGDQYVIKRGCDKTITWCSGLSNSAAFGGFFTIPFEMNRR